MIDQILDHATRGINRLIQQYRGKPNIEALIEVIGERAQTIEDEAYRLFTEQALDFAVGEQLDRFGDIVVQPREGFDDEFYRILLKAKIGINISRGEPMAVTNTVKILTQATLVHYQNLGDASVLLGVDNPIDPTLIEFIYTNMQKVVMAGVRVDAIVCFDPDEPFSFDGTGPVGLGFSSLAAPSTGGKLAWIHRRSRPVFAFDSEAGVSDASGGGFGTVLDPNAGGLLVGL